jgi:subtilisin-like proprotein convertase family protein
VGLIVALGLDLVGVHSPVAADGPLSFCNTASIAIPASGTANPYPSNITVSGLSDLVDTVTVTLNNLSHHFPSDIDILLVGPEGQNLILMGDTGDSVDISNVTLTFDDAAAVSLPISGQIVTGTFKPTNFFDFGEGGDSFPAPAPAPSGATTLATFTGTDPNGTWSLYVVDDTEFDVGSIAGGWCVTVTTAAVPVFDFAGFFPPVDNLPTFNTVNAGRAIPVKFSLEGDQGLAIFASGSPSSQQIACDSSAPLDPVEETVPAGGSQLTYDAATDTYTYVWKTAKAWAGTCRLLILRLTDGSEHLAQFAFR